MVVVVVVVTRGKRLLRTEDSQHPDRNEGSSTANKRGRRRTEENAKYSLRLVGTTSNTSIDSLICTCMLRC